MPVLTYWMQSPWFLKVVPSGRVSSCQPSFFYADHINTPLLMYHGEKDNNSGTFIIQSERMLQALNGLGKNAVLYIYPFESHAPRSIENFLDLWARWIDWFDRYVKQGAGARAPFSAMNK